MRSFGTTHRPGSGTNPSSPYGTSSSTGYGGLRTSSTTAGSRGGGTGASTGQHQQQRTIAPAFGSLAMNNNNNSSSTSSSNRPGSTGYGGGSSSSAATRASSAGIGSRLPPTSSYGSRLGNNNNNNNSNLGSPSSHNSGRVGTSHFQTTNSQIGSHATQGNSLLRSLRPGSSGAMNMPHVNHDPHHPAANGAFGNHHAGMSSTSGTSPSSTTTGGTGRIGLSRFGNTIGGGSPALRGGAANDHHHGNGPAFSCTVLSSQSRSSSKPLSIHVGSGCTQGFRPTMEDEHVNLIGAKTVDGNPLSLFAILDGHCGRRVAELGSQMLPEVLFNHPMIGQNNAQAFVESILQVDKQIHAAIRNQDGGATLITALVHKRMLFVACLGDARAVLCDSGVAIPMSVDHKPSDSQEQARIVRCGGFVHFGRVSGCLAVSRALGDFEFKISMGRFVQKEFQVSNIADIRQINLTDGSRFLILACDGLWDVMGNDEAVSWVNDYLSKHENQLLRDTNGTLNRCGQALAEAAVAKGSTDNVSATVVLFHAPGKD